MKILFLSDPYLSADRGSEKAQRAIFDLIRATSNIVPAPATDFCVDLNNFRGALSRIPRDEKILVISPTIISAPKRQNLLSRLGICAFDDTQTQVKKRVDAAIANEVHDRNLRILHVAEAKETEGCGYQLRRFQSNMSFDDIPKLGADSAISIDPDCAGISTSNTMKDFEVFIKGLFGVKV